nr:dynein heavy chain 6; axonemal [Biomphalaria glabrata]
MASATHVQQVKCAVLATLSMNVPFMNLEPEEVTSTTMKYLKTVQMLEKGLPPNDVVSMLKKKVEVMKQRLQSEEMMEIAGMASSQAALEAILKKVVDAWKHVEFLYCLTKIRKMSI